MKHARLSFVALSLSAITATLGACTSDSKREASVKAAKAPKPLADTDLYRWLSDPAAVSALGRAKNAAIPGTRFANLTATPGAPSPPSAVLRATISEMDPQDVRLAGVKTAELLHASLTKKQLASLVKSCLQPDREIADVSGFGCPSRYLGYRKAALETFNSFGTFNEARATEVFDESLAGALEGLQTPNGLEPLIPLSDAQAKSAESFSVASFTVVGVFPNLKYDETPVMASLSADGSLLATTYFDPLSIEVRNLATGDVNEFRVPDTTRKTYLTAGVFSPDGTMLIGTADGLVVVWDTANQKVLFNQTFPGRNNTTSRLGPGNLSPIWSPDGKHVITEAGLDTFVWDTTTWKPVRKHPVAHHGAWSPNSLRYALIGIDDRPINEEIYESESKSTDAAETPDLQTSIFSLATEKAEHDTVGVHTSGQFTSDGNHVVLQTNNDSVLWDLSSGQKEPVENSAEIRSSSFEMLGYRFANPNGSGSIVVSKNGGAWSADGHRVAGFSNSGVTVYSDISPSPERLR